MSIAVCLICVVGCRPRPDLAGTWVMQHPDEAQEEHVRAAELPQWTLTLKGDGTFSEHVENHVMMIFIEDASGRYTRSGDTLTLSGTSESYMDDGYRKESRTEPLTTKLKYAGNTLTLSENEAEEVVFRREGDHAPPKPKSHPKRSDPRAIQILREMRRRYAALDTYADEGTLTSSGKGFMWENARFQTRFGRRHAFRFQVIAIADGKEWDRNVVWSDGKKTQLYMGSVGGSDERSFGNALSTISPISGYESMLVPALLSPDEYGEPTIDASFEEIALAGEETVLGNQCYVISLSNPGGMPLKLWIAKSSYLILRAYDEMANAMMDFHPQCNIKIAESEFNFSVPQ